MTAPRIYDSSLTADVPHFAPPATPSRSPFKDTLHRRSPTKQLRVGAKATLHHEEYQRIVGSEISTAAEKELATRVVKAADRLKEWCREIEQWGWSGSFDKRHNEIRNNPFERADPGASLSPDLVEEYDSRLDQIDAQLEELEIDDLKEQILGIHLGRSRPSSSYSSASTTNVVLYDEFQLFVTEALLHALPYHAKLKHYLKVWLIRLEVFSQVPPYLNGLSFLQDILQEAWQGLKHASTPAMDEKEVDALEEQLTTAQTALRYKVSELGKQLDRMLDILEGQEDCLPDEWIDKYEDNEKSYAEWSYQADRKLFQLRHIEKPSAKSVAPTDSVARLEQPNSTIKDSSTEYIGTGATTMPITEHEQDGERAIVPAVMHDHTELNTSLPPPSADVSFASVRVSTPPPDPANTLNGSKEAAGLQDGEKHSHSDLVKAAEDTLVEVNESDHEEAEEAEIVEAVHRPVEAVLRRASVASIESFTRDQVKSVDVPSRRSSVASFSSDKRRASRHFDSVTSSPNEVRRSSRTTSPLATGPAAAWPDIKPYDDEAERPQTPPNSVPMIRRNSNSSIASTSSNRSDDLEPGEESPSVRASTNHASRPPLNLAMRKRRNKESNDSTRGASMPFSDHDSTLDTIPASPTKVKSPASPTVPLDEQISNILESLPTARIKLKTSATPNAPEIKPKHKRKSSNASIVSTTSDAPSASRPSAGVRTRAVTPSLSTRPGITLAPADDQGPRRGGANDPEIKVYHLMSGNEKPLKLFIRRVGENGERVMVRVGGGWADLAEYLRTYAEHHGHRAVSDGRVEVLGLGNDRVVTPSAAPGSNGRASALGMRSESRMEGRSESRLGTRSDSRQGNHSRRSSLISSIGYPSITTTGKDVANSPSPVTTEFGPDPATPTSAVPTPTTTTSQRRISGLWDTESPSSGLMGPAAVKKNGEMSNEKKEWVESVVEQAKKVGRKGVEFGDLGKKGGTRRVFMKGRVASGAGGDGKEKE